ncbi:MAG: PilZ domain-containing protein [bacterium]|nr:PilZ domain-containing protein [bacterium]
MTDLKNERRRADRLDANLKLEIQIPGDDGKAGTAQLETINISSSGVYFKSDHFIEPMTKLVMELEVCVPDEGGEIGEKRASVPCEGIVVRTKPEAETIDCEDYEIAVFFTLIEPEGMENLERHITFLMADLD